MTLNIQSLYQTFGLDQVYHLSDMPLPVVPPADALNIGLGPALAVQGNQRIMWQSNIYTAWIPPDPQPTLPLQQGHVFLLGRPYAPPVKPTPGNAANPPGNVSAFGAVPVYVVPPTPSGAIIPMVGVANEVAQGGTAVVLVTGPCNGGWITNPVNAAAQGIVTAENLYIDMVNPPGSTDATAYGSTVLLTPGQNFTIPAIGSGVVVWGNCATSGHKVSVTVW